jgi:enterochelin esterase-like enzyme
MYKVASALMRDPDRSVRVYLPPSYDRPESRERTYPVLFLLHGWPGGDGNWPGEGRCADTLDSLSARGAIPELIAVIPNGTGVGTFGRSIWLDSADGRAPLERYLARELPVWVDSSFRVRRDPADWTVIGLSDGGTSAFNLVIRYPERFGGAGSLSGSFTLEREFGINDALAGPKPGSKEFLDAASPFYEAEKAVSLRTARLYIDCGLEDSELEDNRAFHRELERLGVRHEYQEFPGGHGWGYWRVHLRDALLALEGAGSRPSGSRSE